MQPEAKPVKPVTPQFAADFLGLSKNTLMVWRCTKRYDLPYIKVGGRVMYDMTDLEKFLASRKVNCRPAARRERRRRA